MASPANSTVQNLLPVQAYFNVDGSFNTFIGQGVAFYATANPVQSGLTITNSTINSTTIGALVPSTAVFSSGQVNATPTGSTDIANKLYVDSVAAGLSWKAPVTAATTVNITLSGTQTVDTVVLVVGNTVLVKNQSNSAQNGIYTVNTGAWTYATGSTTWEQYVSALVFIEFGTQASSAWYCTAQPGGTLGTTAMVWSNFSVSGNYTAGTGLTLSSYQFSITNTGVSANTYGSASIVPVIAVNAQGQITSATNTTIAITNAQVSGLGTMSTQNASAVAITGGTIDGTTIGGTSAGAITGTTITANTQFTGAGTGLTGTASSLSIGGTSALATSIAGGVAGSLPYQSAANTTTLLGIGTTGQVLTVAAGVPSWANPAATGVTSVSGTGTVSGISLSGTVTSTGNLTLGGTLDLSVPPAIGGTTANTIRGTTITATTGFVGTNFDATGSGGGALRTNTGNNCLQWGGGGGVNVTIDGPININGANSAIQINPTGTGTVSIAPAGALTVNPTTASTMNNVAIGGTTPLAGTFTDLRVNNTISLAGATGSAGQVLTSNGASAPTWTTVSAGLTVTDDTTTSATRYLTFTSATSGTISGINTASTKLTWNPGTGVLSLAGSTGALSFPSGTDAQRPASPVAGMTRWSTTNTVPEVYTGATNGWQKFTISAYSYTITYLVVAGGGGGAGSFAGGGGAGGLLASSATVNVGVTCTATIGGGGADGGGAGGGTGSNSVLSGTGIGTVTSIGGGGGGQGGGSYSAGSGGSGGGGGGFTSGFSNVGGAGTSGQGNSGGNNSQSAPNYGAGGGGGAGAVGNSGTSGSGGNGGAGSASSITGSSVTYAGGGGGSSIGGAGSGGSGGGGAGGFNVNGTSGTANTGGGGGSSNGVGAGTGGSGVVILSVPTASYSGTTTGSPTVTTSGSNTIIKFTASGTYVS